MAIDYSDGAPVEAEILEILSRTASLGSDQAPGAERYDGSWPIEYHLTPERASLVRHLDFSGLDVLELGAGMGGVSRFLAESAARLEVIEGTEERFAALSQRLRDRDNWSGRVANLAEAAFERRHDVVCVIGVLEYSELYVKPPEGHTPFSWFLHRAGEALKDDGVLLLAIENRLGLKYWSGAAEDHTGRLYDGICGYPAEKTARTFSLAELRGLLAGAGFGAVEEYFPFPDYKVPASVLSRRFVDECPQAAAALATMRPYENYGQPRLRQFPELLAADGLARAKLLGEMANSFLVAAARRSDSPTLLRLTRRQAEGERAWHYGCRRRLPTRTIFRETSEGVFVTAKEPLRPADGREARFEEGDLRLRWSAGSGEPLAGGEPLRLRFARFAYWNDAAACLGLLDDFLRWSFARWKHEDERRLDGKALDAILGNAVHPFALFDLEWSLDEPMPKSWFVLRNVLGLYADRDLFPRQTPFRSPGELYDELCRRHGLRPELAADTDREARLQALVTDRASIAFHRRCLETVLAKPLGAMLHPRFPTEEERAFLALLQTKPLKALGRLTRLARNQTWLKNGAKKALRLSRLRPA